MTQPHATKLFAETYRNSIMNRKWDRKSLWIYSTGVKKTKQIPIGFVVLWSNEWFSFTRVNNEKSFNGSIEMKLSWPRGWGQETRMLLQPNLTPAWTPCVSSIWFDSSRCFWGREGGTRVPWRLTRGWRFGKSTLTFDVGASGVDSRCPPSPSNTPHHLRGFSLAVWPLQWPLDTVHVSHVLAVANGLCPAVRSAAKY